MPSGADRREAAQSSGLHEEITLSRLAIGVAGLLFTAILTASVAVAATAEEADQLYQAQDWPGAEKAYRELTEASPDNAVFKYRLAVTLRHQRKYQAAGMWLDQAGGGNVPGAYIEVERARLLAAMGDPGGAIRALDAAAEQGFSNTPGLTEDTALETLADDPRFEEVLKKMDKNRVPCEYIPEFSQFDFWVGDWRVVSPEGVFQGTNRIEKTQGGCLLVENWTGAGGTTGTSMNFYDLKAKEWVQVWVSPGLQLEIRGGIEGDSMVLIGYVYYVQNGESRPFRGTWTPLEGGVVRQHFEESEDGGQTWTTWFDGRYHRQETSGQDAG